MFRRIGAGMVLAILGIAACAQIPTSRPVDATQTELATTSTTTTQPAPEEPFVYRVGVLDGLSTTNFWAFQGEQTTVWNAYILGPTKPSLYSLHPSSAAFQFELATHHAEAVEENEQWRVTIDLNPDLKWSDGQPITAGDLAFTFDIVRRFGLEGAWAESFPAAIASVTADTPTRAIIEFTERPTLAVWPHSIGLAPIMPAHVWDEAIGDLTSASLLYSLDATRDVGGGPLALESVSETMIVSVANPGYTPAPAPDRVEYLVYTDEANAIEAMNQGAIDTMLSPRGLNVDHLGLIDPDQDITVEENPANGVRYIGFNLDREPMSEQAFRTALALLLQREIHTFIGDSNILWYDPVAAAAIAAPYSADLEQRLASALDGLRAAGYTWDTDPTLNDGALIAGTGLRIGGVEPQTLTILTPGDAWDPARPLYAAEVARALEVLGFRALPVETDFDTVVDLAFTTGEDGTRQYDMYLLGWTLGNPSLPGFHSVFFAADGVMNNTGYDSPRFAEELARYEGSYNTDEARRALWAMEAILSEDLPYLLLYASSITEGYRSDRVTYRHVDVLGGIQGRLGGIADVRPAG